MEVNKYGFKNVYGIDLGMSIMLYQKNYMEYEESACYNNAFSCLAVNLETNRNNRAIIGYVLSTDGKRKAAVRHAWNEINGVKVDVTMLANEETRENPISIIYFSYLPIRVMTATEFLDAIEANRNMPCLPKDKREEYYLRELRRKGFELLDEKVNKWKV